LAKPTAFSESALKNTLTCIDADSAATLDQKIYDFPFLLRRKGKMKGVRRGTVSNPTTNNHGTPGYVKISTHSVRIAA
jgi:hypothetical protein